MREMIEQNLGTVAAQRANLTTGKHEVIINVFFLERPSDISISIKVQLVYIGPRTDIDRRHQPAPEGLRLALRKGWDRFERQLLILQETMR